MKTTEQNADVGVIVAKFQSPFLHEGHLDIIKQVRENHPRVIVFLGVSVMKCSFGKPYDFPIREAMVKEKFPDVEVYPIDDVGDDDVWSQNLDESIKKYTGPHLKIVLYGSRDSFIAKYSGTYPTIELIPVRMISARDIRRQVSIKAKNTEDFRIGIAYAVQNQFPSTKATVDVVILDRPNRRILLGRKKHKKLFHLVGGFSEPDPAKSPSFEADAIRETKEETRLDVTDPTYITSTFIDDGRYKDERDKIKTLLYVVDYPGGEFVPSDDLKGGELKWFDIDTLNENEISENHRPLIAFFKKWAVKTGLMKDLEPKSGTKM